mgnify:CR=1 FL=1
MSNDESTVHPSLRDLSDYLKGLGTIQLLRDQERHSQQKLAETKIQEARLRKAKADVEVILRDIKIRYADALVQFPELNHDFAYAVMEEASQVEEWGRNARINAAQLNSLAKQLHFLKACHANTSLFEPALFSSIDACLESANQVATRLPPLADRFIKIAVTHDGVHELDPWVREWRGVLDTHSDLVWEAGNVKTCHANGVTLGSCCDYLQTLNTPFEGVGVVWRLPTLDELAALAPTYVYVDGWAVGWNIHNFTFFTSSERTDCPDGYFNYQSTDQYGSFEKHTSSMRARPLAVASYFVMRAVARGRWPR